MALKVEYRIGIAAPVDDAYNVMADIDAWPTWSPIHKAASGRLSFGAPVVLEEYYEGLGTWEQTGVLADWVPLSMIHITIPKPFYAGSLTRYFEFEALSENGCVFTVGAMFNGFLSEREGKRYREFLRKGFEAMGQALKIKVEAEHDPDAPPPHLPPSDEYNKKAARPKPKGVRKPKFFGNFK